MDNWNTIAICDTTGSVGERYAYSAYGAPVFMTGAGTVQTSSPVGFETLYAGYRWDNPAPQMYYVRNRYLLPQVGTWNKRDPLGYVGGMGLLAYSTPIVGSDPTGMMPNLKNLVPIEFIIGEIRKIETAHPGKSPAEILRILNARMKSNSNWWYYVYTRKSGFIDLPHFTESAIWSSDPNIQDCCGSHSVYLTYAGSIGVEINQVVFQAYHDWMMKYLAIYWERLSTAAKNENNGWKKWFLQQLVWGAFPLEGAGSSAFTPEDLHSNWHGAVFGGQLSGTVPLSKQIDEYFAGLSPVSNLEGVPYWGMLPVNEGEWERWYQTQSWREKQARRAACFPPKSPQEVFDPKWYSNETLRKWQILIWTPKDPSITELRLKPPLSCSKNCIR